MIITYHTTKHNHNNKQTQRARGLKQALHRNSIFPLQTQSSEEAVRKLRLVHSVRLFITRNVMLPYKMHLLRRRSQNALRRAQSVGSVLHLQWQCLKNGCYDVENVRLDLGVLIFVHGTQDGLMWEHSTACMGKALSRILGMENRDTVGNAGDPERVTAGTEKRH